MSTRTQQKKNIGEPERRSSRAFTLTELLVVVTVGVVLILVVAPSLQAAAGKSKTQVCLDNLRKLGLGVRLYAEAYDGVLPGPVHPALYHNVEQYFDTPYQRYRFLPWRLRNELGDAFDDRIITCPLMAEINPDRNFIEFSDQMGRVVPPTHYALNSAGASGTRVTNPPYYFGTAYPSTDPKPIGAVPNADREWMIADAWYRPRANPAFPELQQEGPYQYGWTGEALPNFAPHERRGSRSYSFTSADERGMQSAEIRQAKSDGLTNTLYFDGHAASSPPRTYRVSGWEFLYAFRGTVNPAMEDPPPDHAVWQGVWR